jgi:hypothetical protein
MSVRNLGWVTGCCLFAFLGIFIHLEKDNGSYTPCPNLIEWQCRNDIAIQLGAIISVADTVPSGDRSIANCCLLIETKYLHCIGI